MPVCGLILGACAHTAASGRLAGTELESLKQGIFEVVVPKLTDPKVTYRDPPADDLLPYHVRTDRFISIGTAFYLGEGLFASAAHVFSPELPSQYADYFLRDSTGKTYRLGKIIKYSNYRDCIVFTLQTQPDNAVALKTGSVPRIGDDVFSAGNALGEGIVFRQGQIASRTPEPVDGKWQSLRFTAPASPGNSGGPLLNTHGEVLGIVTAKSPNENLNHALPIDELSKVSPNNAELYARGLSESEAGQSLQRAWSFNTPLPRPLAELAEKAQASLREHLRETRHQFEKAYADSLFPVHKEVDTYLRDQTSSTYFGSVALNSGKWSLSAKEWRSIDISAGRMLHFSGSNQAQIDFFLDKPEGVALSEFIDNPTMINDTLIQTLELGREVAGKDVRWESLGPPAETSLYRDRLDRLWRIWTWRLGVDNTTVYSACLPTPSGVACTWYHVSTQAETFLVHNARLRFDSLLFSYRGPLSQWAEFLALPTDRLPPVLGPGSSVHKRRAALEVSLGHIKGRIRVPGLSDQSLLEVNVGYDLAKPTQASVIGLRLYPHSARERRGFGVSELYEPSERSPKAHRDLWDKLTRALPPFHGSPVRDGAVNVIRSSRIKQSRRNDVQERLVFFCFAADDVTEKVLARQCKRFHRTIRVKAEPKRINRTQKASVQASSPREAPLRTKPTN